MNKIIITLLLMTLISCAQNKKLESLENQVQSLIENNQNDTLLIKLDSLSVSNFDHFLILTPYVQTIEEMESTLDLDLSNVSDAIQDYDHFNIIVLVKDKKSIGYFNLTRSFEIFNNPRSLHKYNKVLKIKNKEGHK